MSDLARVEEMRNNAQQRGVNWPDTNELCTIAKKALTRLDAAQAVIQRVWEHGCCCSDEKDYCKCDMVKAAKDWLEEAPSDGAGG